MLPGATPSKWLPDETLYSWCARYHIASRHPTSAATCRALFDHPRLGSRHDFPCRLDQFCKATELALGDPSDIVWRRSVLPYFIAFRPSLAHQPLELAKAPSIGGAKFQVGLLTTGTRAHIPLRACSDCIGHDCEHYGVAYWHRAHQWPGVWACSEHGTPLLFANTKHNGTHRFHFVLPNTVEMLPIEPCASISALVSLAQTIEEQVPHAPANIKPASEISSSISAALRALGFTHGSRVAINDASEAFARFNQAFSTIPENSAFPTTHSAAQSILTRAISNRASQLSTIRQISVLCWVSNALHSAKMDWPTATDFDTDVATHKKSTLDASDNDGRTESEQRLIDAVLDGESVRSAADAQDIPLQRALEIASSSRVPYTRRPKTLTDDIRSQIVSLAKQGQTRKQIANKVTVSLPTVGRVIRSTPDLPDLHRARVFERERSTRRADWQRIQEAHAFAPSAILRSLAPSTYMWLYRHDRTWLEKRANLNSPADRKSPRASRWDSRDLDIAKQIDSAALKILDQPNSKAPIRLADLRRHVPDLPAVLARLGRLPLTTRAIERALSHS